MRAATDFSKPVQLPGLPLEAARSSISRDVLRSEMHSLRRKMQGGPSKPIERPSKGAEAFLAGRPSRVVARSQSRESESRRRG